MIATDLFRDMKNIWNEEEFLSARTVYAQNHDIDFKPTYLCFAYNSRTCPLKIKTYYLEVFFEDTYKGSTEYLEGLIEQDYLSDIDSTIHTLEWLDIQLLDLREKFEISDDMVMPVRMRDELPPGYLKVDLDHGGIFTTQKDECLTYATTATVLAHEYVHYLFWRCGGGLDNRFERWMNEAVAYYYTLPGSYEERIIFSAKEGWASLDELEALIGQPFDDPSDEILFVRKVLRTGEFSYLTMLKTDYSLCAAFGEYFVREYGESAFLSCMIHPSETKQLVGLSMDEILDAWIVDMKNPSKD